MLTSKEIKAKANAALAETLLAQGNLSIALGLMNQNISEPRLYLAQLSYTLASLEASALKARTALEGLRLVAAGFKGEG